MDKFKKIVIIALPFFLLSFGFAWAGDLTDAELTTFVAEEPAVAAEVNANFDAVQEDVNDNDSRITTNAGAITTSAGVIITNTTGISTNAGAIATNAAGVSANADNVTTNTDNIQNVDDDLAAFFGGDGSAGDVEISANTSWLNDPPSNPNFNNLTIDSGFTLTVPAGTIIRCAGSFINNGILSVYASYGGTYSNWSTSAGVSVAFRTYPHPGDSRRPAFAGGYNQNSIAAPAYLYSGFGGFGIYKGTVATSFHLLRYGGGSGAGWNAGSGGGIVKIYSRDSLDNAGTIAADGSSAPGSGSGGGGGGIVILASMVSIDNSTGTIQANGGNGGNSASYAGSGGGGGGGIILMVAPSIITDGGAVSYTGGTAGDNSTDVTTASRTAGGGGGACGGNGGNGGAVPSNATATPGAGGNGTEGYLLTIEANPFYMIH